jgi:hypothetical protein
MLHGAWVTPTRRAARPRAGLHAAPLLALVENERGVARARRRRRERLDDRRIIRANEDGGAGGGGRVQAEHAHVRV